MTEEEIMIRAREAALTVWDQGSFDPAPTRHGDNDRAQSIRIAARALRDLSKPLEEIRPVDPDLIEARKIAASLFGSAPESYLSGINDDFPYVRIARTAIKRGRELGRGK